MLLTLLFAAPLPAAGGELTFVPVRIFIDSGERPLAAYQFELSYDRRAVSLAGVEGGEGVWREAPYYDPRGLESGRIVIAAFTTDRQPPAGRIRVATIHLAIESNVFVEEGLDATLTVAVDPDETPVEAAIEIVPVDDDQPVDE